MTDATAADPQTRPYTYRLSSFEAQHPDRPQDGGDTITIQIDDSRDALLTDFGRKTMDDRYLKDGESYQDMFARVACANSDATLWGTDEGTQHAQRMYDYMSKGWFMGATPVLSNSGVERGLPISCYLNEVGDSMESIADAVTENIWLASGGGGIGTSWSPVRSEGELIGEGTTSVGKTSGIIPFLQWMDAQTQAISQGSLRRGSAAAYLDISHPEIEEFVDIRRHNGGDPRRKAHNIHHGVMVPDSFMEKALNNEPDQRAWDLVSPKTGAVIKTVDARELLVKLLVVRMETGEPYIVFSDSVNRNLPAIYKALGMNCTQSNLCSEITLHTGIDYQKRERTAVCCLGSLNFAKAYEWNGDAPFIEDVMRFLDNVLENFIRQTEGRRGYERARYAAMQERSVGCGMMGLQTLLQSAGVLFESKQALELSDMIWKFVSEAGAAANVKLAQERGECPDSAAARAIDSEVIPQRLTHMFSIAPTASISIICQGVSPCGEPLPANVYNQKTLSGSYEVRNPELEKLLRRRFKEIDKIANLKEFSRHPNMFELLKNCSTIGSVVADQQEGGITEDEWIENQWHKILLDGGSVANIGYLTEYERKLFKTGFEIDQRWVIEHAAVRQPYICQAQSTNLFLPADVSKQDLWTLHKEAWEKGLKSLYYLRSRSLARAHVATNMAGEMPKAETVSSGQLYEGDLSDCESCQ